MLAYKPLIPRGFPKRHNLRIKQNLPLKIINVHFSFMPPSSALFSAQITTMKWLAKLNYMIKKQTLFQDYRRDCFGCIIYCLHIVLANVKVIYLYKYKLIVKCDLDSLISACLYCFFQKYNLVGTSFWVITFHIVICNSESLSTWW